MGGGFCSIFTGCEEKGCISCNAAMDGRIKAESDNYKKVNTKEMQYIDQSFSLTFKFQRQKQYFEQRKRQKQHHTAGLESNTDGVSLLGQDNKERRSLDVLSLLNLSSIVQECKTSSPNVGENSEVNTSTVNYQLKKGPSTILTNGVAPADYVEFDERASSGYQVEIASPKSDADRHNSDFNGKGDKPDNWKTATEHQLSVFDLLGDDGPYSNLEGSPVYEAHVAFSVEGLGKVGTETPVHSPHQPHRISSYDCSSPRKDARQLRSSKNFNFVLDDLEVEVDAMMQDINMSPSGSSLELPFYPMGIVDPFSSQKQGVSTFRDFMHHGGHSGKIRSSFGDEEIVHNVKDKSENIWNGSAGFPDYNSPDDGECDLSWKHWPGQMDGTSADFIKIGNHELLDLTSEGPYISKKRNAMRARDRFNISDLCAPYLRHQTSENDHDFVNSDGTRSPMLERIWGFTDVTNQPDWPSFATEDARGSPSLLSEESCSSSAVRGEATYNPPSNSMARKIMRRHHKGFCSRVNKSSSKNILAKETWYKNGNDIGPSRNNVNGSGEFTRKSNPSSSKSAHHSNSAFLGKVGPHESWLFGDGSTSVDINPDFSSLYRTSETNHVSPNPKFWTDDPSGAFPVPELHIGAKTLYEQSKRGFPVEYSPSSSAFSEKPEFYKPSNHTHSYGSPIFGDIGARPDEPDLSLEMEGKPPDSFQIAGSLGDREFPDISVQESVSKYEEHASSIQPTDCQQFGLEKEICNANNGVSSEAGKPRNASDSRDNCSRCKEAEDETPEIVATNSSENAEEASSEAKITDKFEGGEEGKRCHHDTQLPLAFLKRNTVNQETENQGSEETLVIRREQNKCLETVDPSCQVMMLESYVLQLLCVQKVLKEASAQDSEKKV